MGRRSLIAFAALICAAGAAVPAAEGQLRPLDPLPIEFLGEAAPPVYAQLGFGLFGGQRASLAGTEGTLAEVGNFRAVWRTGRVGLEVGGTVQRRFEDERRFSEPSETVADAGPRRTDSGDYRLATSVRLTPLAWPALGFVRFGTRLPTTDNTVGLDRDRTDFFATVGAHSTRGRLALGAEAGLGIFGTRHHRLEQSDVLLYAASAAYRAGPVIAEAVVLGHADGIPDSAIRGSEELGEVRVGARTSGRLWLGAHLIRGFTDYSPKRGILIAGGWAPR